MDQPAKSTQTEMFLGVTSCCINSVNLKKKKKKVNEVNDIPKLPPPFFFHTYPSNHSTFNGLCLLAFRMHTHIK